MTREPAGTHAVVRGVPGTYDRCIKPDGSRERIDVAKAGEQHGRYCSALREMGLTLVEVAPDDRFPDCCFVEDTAIVAGDTAIIARMAVPARDPETADIKKILSGYKKTRDILPPGFIDGGDVLKIGKKIYVGLSGRTNRHAVEQVRALVSEEGYRVVPVEIKGTLHLKTVCTYIGNGCVVMAPGFFDQEIFSEYRRIVVPEEETCSANCLAVNGRVLVPEGYPRTRAIIEKEGFATLAVDISEFRKGNGGLTCLSIIL